jgi:hypothetical protein
MQLRGSALISLGRSLEFSAPWPRHSTGWLGRQVGLGVFNSLKIKIFHLTIGQITRVWLTIFMGLSETF